MRVALHQNQAMLSIRYQQMQQKVTNPIKIVIANT